MWQLLKTTRLVPLYLHWECAETVQGCATEHGGISVTMVLFSCVPVGHLYVFLLCAIGFFHVFSSPFCLVFSLWRRVCRKVGRNPQPKGRP